jgi:hypothetical protein
LVPDYPGRHGHDPSAGAAHVLARQANLETRQGKKPPRSLASKRAAWRAELDEHFGLGAAARLMTAIPDRTRQAAPEPPAPPLDLDHCAERAVAGVAGRRSVWTAWNIRAEADLARAVEKCVAAHRSCFAEPALPAAGEDPPPEGGGQPDPAGKFADRARRKHELVHRLRTEGRGLREIARHLGWDLHTVPAS